MPPPTPADWQIVRLTRTHDRAEFDCGVPSLTEWLVRYAGQFERRDLTRVYVLADPDLGDVRGYYTLSCRAVEHETLPPQQARGLPPRIRVPVALLGHLAVDRHYHGAGFGKLLLLDALSRVLWLSEWIGIAAVEVDAVDDAACRFYAKFGFTPLSDDERHLYMPLSTVRRLGLPHTEPED